MNIDDVTNRHEANKWATNSLSEIESIISNGKENLDEALKNYFQKLDLLGLKFDFDINHYKGSTTESIVNYYSLKHQEQMKRSDEILEYSKNNRKLKRS